MISFPNNLPIDFRKEPYRKAEICFFDKAKAINTNWFLLYGVTWYNKFNNYWKEGEADFVIVGEDIGIVIIEIKGGYIGMDEDGWYSIDRKKN